MDLVRGENLLHGEVRDGVAVRSEWGYTDGGRVAHEVGTDHQDLLIVRFKVVFSVLRGSCVADVVFISLSVIFVYVTPDIRACTLIVWLRLSFCRSAICRGLLLRRHHGVDDRFVKYGVRKFRVIVSNG